MFAFLVLIIALISFFIKKKALSLFLLAALVSGGFWIIGLNTTLFGFVIQMSDLALVYVLVILFVQLLRGKIKQLPRILKPINYFLIFLSIVIMIDLIINGTPLGDVFKTTRHWLFLLFVYLLPSYKEKDILQALKWIIVLTFMQTLLFLTEPVTGKVLFSYQGTLEALSLTNISRYSMLPPFIAFLFVWIFSRKISKQWLKFVGVVLILLAILISQIRSMLLATLIIFIISIFLSKKQKIYKKIIMLFSIISVILLIMFYEPLNERFSSGVRDFNNVTVENANHSSTGFRSMLFLERLNYILEKPSTAIYGLGFIAEKNYKGHQFSIGHYTKDGEVEQLDTGDMTWVLFAVRLGIIGTFFYLLIYLKLLHYFYKYRIDFFALVGLYYLIFALFRSLAGTEMYYGSFILLPALLFQLVRYTKIKDKVNNHVK